MKYDFPYWGPSTQMAFPLPQLEEGNSLDLERN